MGPWTGTVVFLLFFPRCCTKIKKKKRKEGREEKKEKKNVRAKKPFRIAVCNCISKKINFFLLKFNMLHRVLKKF